MTRAVKIPDAAHPITVRPTGSRVTVRVGGVTVAESDNALSLAEASYPVVQYIPIADVDQSLLVRTGTKTYCPYKGDASYYSVRTPGGRTETDLVWTYEQPYRRSPRSRGTWRSTRTARRSPSHSGPPRSRARSAACPGTAPRDAQPGVRVRRAPITVPWCPGRPGSHGRTRPGSRRPAMAARARRKIILHE